MTADLLAPVRRRRLERAFREGTVHRMDRPLHRGRGAVRDWQGEIEPALPLDERRDARLRFLTSGDDGVELPMPECPATPDLWRPLRDGESDVDAPVRLGRLLTFPFLAEHGQGHVDPSRVNPTVDGGEGNFFLRRGGRRSVPGTRSHAASRRSSGASCHRVSSWHHSWSSPSRSVSGHVQPRSRGSV